MKRVVPSGNVNFSQTDLKLENFDPEKEFAIILAAALKQKTSQEASYVDVARKMARMEPKNFYTIAAATIAACFGSRYKKLDKYHAIYLRLNEARMSVNRSSSEEMRALGEVEKLANSAVDIFDFEI